MLVTQLTSVIQIKNVSINIGCMVPVDGDSPILPVLLARNIYLRADDKRCILRRTAPSHTGILRQIRTMFNITFCWIWHEMHGESYRTSIWCTHLGAMHECDHKGALQTSRSNKSTEWWWGKLRAELWKSILSSGALVLAKILLASILPPLVAHPDVPLYFHLYI